MKHPDRSSKGNNPIMPSGKLYIAYGSNLNLKQMKHRCPTAEVVGTSELVGYKLVFRGGLHGGVATVEPDESCSVPVLVWRIYPEDEKSLDSYEGYPHFYRKEKCIVNVSGESVEGMIYIMNKGYHVLRPDKVYYQTILEGYRHVGFDLKILEKYASDDLFNEADRATGSRTMSPIIREQILEIRDSGETNMFDIHTVQYLAYRHDFYELVTYLEEHRKEYVRFIMTGKEN